MGLETGNYVSDLNEDNPPGTDPKSQGDDHLRLIKHILRVCFTGFNGAVLLGGEDVGAVNAYVLNPDEPLPMYIKNTLYVWRAANTNTSPTVTINISALGLRSIRAVDGNNLLPGDIQAGQYVFMVDNGTECRIQGVTKNYVDQLALGTTLPTPPVGEGPFYFIASNGVFSYTTAVVPDFLLQAQGII
jgi:hypothetical protein